MARQEIAREGLDLCFCLLSWRSLVWLESQMQFISSLLCSNYTSPWTGSSALPLPLTRVSRWRNPGNKLLAMPAGITCQDVCLCGKRRSHVWEWELKAGSEEDMRINSDEPSLFGSVRRVFLSSWFSVSSGSFRPSLCWPQWGWWDCVAGGEACEEQTSHGLQLGPTRDFWPWLLRNPPSSCLPRDKETAAFF